MNGFDLWRSDNPLVFFSSSLDEAKGLPAGWVSQWGEKRAQKQTDGSWIYVPVATPLGQQPLLKLSPVTKSSFDTGTFKPSQDDEMMSYLKSVNVLALAKSPKFVGDMLKKFGAGWFDKYKALIATPNAGNASTPATPVDAPAPTSSDPLGATLTKLNVQADSPEGFVVGALFKNASLDSAINAYSKKFGMKYAVAYDTVEAFVKKAANKGVFSLSGDFESGMKVKFNIGTGPVISAPVIAVSSPVAPPAVAPPQPHAKKKKAVAPEMPAPIFPATPVPAPEPAQPAPIFTTPAPAPAAPAPATTPAMPPDIFKAGVAKTNSFLQALGYKPGSAGAIAVGLLLVHGGDTVNATQAFMSVTKNYTLMHAAKMIMAVRGEMLAFSAGTPPPTLAPVLVRALNNPPADTAVGADGAVSPSSPVDVPTQATSKKGIALPLIPSIHSLSFAGDAKVKLGGNKPKKFLKDNGGTLFLHKYGADRIRAAGGEVAANIAAVIGGAGAFVPVKSIETDGDWGTIQPMVPNVAGDLSNVDFKSLTSDQKRQLLRERVIDWVASNHDSKAGNFIKTKDGNILGIDKEQAFKFIGTDELSLDYSPNPSDPIYNAFFKAYVNKEIDLDLNDALPFIEKVEAKADEDWKNAVQPYLDALPEEQRETTWSAILKRKKSVRDRFEAFFTHLKHLRGEKGAFEFATPAAPQAVAQPVSIPGVGVLTQPKVPSMAELTYSKKADIGGAGEKHFFTDKNGKVWLLKVAAGKASKKPEPWKVASQVLFSAIAQNVKPSSPPVGAVEYNGQLATIQPWLGDDLPTLAANTKNLSLNQKLDIAKEHILDWLMSQHDTHAGNLLILPTGEVVGIDKEQGFKYLLPNPKWTNSTPEGDVLSTDYHPNAQYGEKAPFYNQFWKDWANKTISFNPTLLADAINAIEAVPDDEYVKMLETYGKAAYPEDAEKAVAFYAKALARKKNIRTDFEAFLTDLHEKRTKKKGTFTFDSGWVLAGESTPLGNEPVSAPPAEGYTTKKGKKYPPLPDSLLNLSPKIDDIAVLAGFTPEEKKLFTLWQGADQFNDTKKTKQDYAFDLMANLGWNKADAQEFFAATVEKLTDTKAALTLFNTHIKDGTLKFQLPSLSAPVPGTPGVAPSAVPPVVKPALPPPPAALTPDTVAEAGAAIDINPSSTYWNALDALSKHGSIDGAVNALMAKQPLAGALHLKRVKYVFKQLAALGVKFTPPPSPDATGAPPSPGLKTTAVPDATLYGPNKPTALGEIGVLNPAMVMPEDASKPPVQKKPPTPPGFPEPPDGQMWEVSTAAQFAAKHVYKVKTPKDATGNLDESSPNAVVKLKGLTLDGSKEFLKKLGVDPVQSTDATKPLFKEKDGKVYVLVNKSQWEQAKLATANTQFSQLVPIPPPEPLPGQQNKFKATPKAGSLTNPEAIPNLEEMKTIHESKDIGYGAAFFIDGGAVEQQSVSVQRHVDLNGKEFYRFNFKLREPTLKKLKGGSEDMFTYARMKYDENKDAWVHTSINDDKTEKENDSLDKVASQKWESEGSTFYAAKDTSKYAFKGMIFSDIYPKTGETPFDGFQRMLNAVNPSLAPEILKNPSKNERDLLALSALYWSVAPQQADKLQDENRSVTELKKRLNDLGYTDADFDNLGFERVALDRVTPVLKGRHLKLKQKHDLRSIALGVNTPAKVAQQLLSGSIGIIQRLSTGITGAGTSALSDQVSGGADYVYTRIDKKDAGQSGWPSGYGPIQMCYDLSELDRLDIYQHMSDQYGVCDPTTFGGAYKNRQSLESNCGNAFEACFKRGVSARKLLKVVCDSEGMRQEVIAACKKLGITKMNGMSIEDLVITRGTGGTNAFYNYHLKPAGY